MISLIGDSLDRALPLAARGKARDRVREHVLSAIACLGRHTLSQHIATAGRPFKDWTADYRLYSKGRVNIDPLFSRSRQEIMSHLPSNAPAVVALDDTRLKKSSQKTPGVKYTRDPMGPAFRVNFILTQRFFQMSMAWANEEGRARMIPIDFQHAPVPKKPRKNAPEIEWRNYREACRQSALPLLASQRLHRLRNEMDAEGEENRQLICAVDGGYTNGNFLKNLPQRVTAIGRIRGDAKLYFLPEQQPERGRRRVYGDPTPTPEQLRGDSDTPWQSVRAFACGKQHDFRVKTLGPVRWRATGKQHNLRIVVIAPLGYRLQKKGRLLYRKPAYLICTDPNMSLEDILQYYLWRWDIEVNFRDEKTLLGVGQAQVHHPLSVATVPALSVAAYSLLLTAGTQLYGLDSPSLSIPLPKWHNHKPKRISTQNLIRKFRHELWGGDLPFSDFDNTATSSAKYEKSHPCLTSSLFFGASVT